MKTITASSFPSRSLPLLVAGAIFLNYIDRGTLGVAAPLMKGDFRLSATSFGIAVSAFFWAYAPVQLVVGWLCDRFCVYRLFASGMIVCAISTALTGLVSGFATLIVLRLALGLGESIAFPGGSKIIARHVPASRRGVANAVVAAGIALGPAVGTLAGGLIMASYGWRAMFVVFGLATLAWFAPWRQATRIFTQSSEIRRESPFAFAKLLRVPALWRMSVGHFIGNYILYFILTWLPLYLVKSRGYEIADMTVLATLVYVAQALSALVTGWGSDKLAAGGWREGSVRKLLLGIGSVGMAGAIMGIASASSSSMLVVWLVAAGVFQGFKGGNIFALAQMFAGPRYAGGWVGVQNTIANFAGILGPVITGMIIDGTGSYTSALWVTAAVAGVGAIWWYAGVPRVEPIELD